ncbi:hypothetical protein HY489_01920 [Candidatus Woesearchaeota archaeon]|nr:hypothetical protein [Candidatus Woesearchaeota archaeon]
MIGIIGGTGFSDKVKDAKPVETDYGTVNVGKLYLGGREVAFVARHAGLEVPHKVNSRGNIQALKMAGVNTVYAVSACGRLAKESEPGTLGAVEDLDWDAFHSPASFAEDGSLLLHATMNPPFSQEMRRILTASWPAVSDRVHELYGKDLTARFLEGGTYFNIQGPAFSTQAREERIRNTTPKATYIGQTLVPEAHLAREMAMAYAAVAMVVDHSNYPGAKPVTHADGVMFAVLSTAQTAYWLLEEAVKKTPEDLQDPAHQAFKHSLHSSQVDLAGLRRKGRINLANIIEAELKTRETS